MTLATWLTVARFFLVPAFVVAYFAASSYGRVVAVLVLALAGLTDVLDGYLARRRREESLAGRLLDPLADKLVILSGVATMVAAGRLRLWIGLVLIAKEALLVIGAVVFFVKRREMIASNFAGKLATVLLYLGLFSAILEPVTWRLGEMLVLAGVVCSLVAGLGYTRIAMGTTRGA